MGRHPRCRLCDDDRFLSEDDDGEHRCVVTEDCDCRQSERRRLERYAAKVTEQNGGGLDV